MRTLNFYPKHKIGFMALLAFLLLTVGMTADAAIFTATSSGNWSSSATWAGGNAPGSDISAHDVTISNGVTVTMDTDVMINSVTANLDVQGVLDGANYSITLVKGTVSGTGQIIVDELKTSTDAVFLFAGSVNTDTYINNGATVALAASTTVNEMMELNGGDLQLASGSSLDFQNGATIVIDGGQMSLNGGVFTGVNSYHVIYEGNSTTTGVEIMGSGLTDAEVNLSAYSQQLTLNNDLELNGDLALSRGQVVIGDHSVMVGGNISCSTGSGSILSSSNSDITMNGSGNSNLYFHGNSGTVGNLTVNVGSVSTVTLENDLTVSGDFEHQSGTISLNDNSLTLMGNITANGSFEGTTNSGIIIETTGNVSGSLTFDAGSEMLGQLTIDIQSPESIMLGSDLTVNGTFEHESGELDMGSDNTLDVSGQVSFGSEASISSGETSNIYINSTGSVTGNIQFDSNSNSVGDFTVNASGNGMVNLGSDMNIEGTLSLEGGTFSINANTLSINGDISASGSGNLAGGSGSSVEIHSNGDISGQLTFDSNNNALENLVIDLNGDGSVQLGSDVEVNGTLDLQDGYVALGNNNLTINASGDINGGTSNTYVMTNGNGLLQIMINAGSQGSFYPVGTDVHFAPMTLAQASGSSNGMFGVSALSGVYTNGVSGNNMASASSVVNTSWIVESGLSTGIDLEMTAEWDASMEVNSFNRTEAYISHYTNSSWDVAASGNATTNTEGRFEISRSGITSLSPFAVFDSNTSVGVEERQLSLKSTLYPNPVNTTLTYDLADYKGNVSIEIFDASNRLIRSVSVSQPLGNIDVTSLAPGHYVVRFTDEVKNVSYGKVIKQ